MNIKYIYSIFLLFLVVSCKTKNVLPESIGEQSELIIVANTKLWTSPFANSIKKILLDEFPNFTHQQFRYKIIQIKPIEFNSKFKKYRNIVIIQLKNDSSGVRFLNNVWASNQLVVEINLSNKNKSLDSATETNISTRLKDFELAHLKHLFKIYGNEELSKQIQSKHNIDIALPSDFKLIIDSLNFFYLKRGPETSTQNLFYAMLNESSLNITKERCYNIIDSLSKKYVNGNAVGSYMKIDRIQSVFDSSNRICNGLWEIKEDDIRGPLIIKFSINPFSNHLEVWCGFVYAPNKPKRDLLAHLEGIMPY